MPPYSIPFHDRLQEIKDRKAKVQDEIKMNKDVINSLDALIDDNCWHLSNIPLRYQLTHPNTEEYRQIQKEETRLEKSCEGARNYIDQLRRENVELKRRVDQLINEINQCK